MMTPEPLKNLSGRIKNILRCIKDPLPCPLNEFTDRIAHDLSPIKIQAGLALLGSRGKDATLTPNVNLFVGLA